MIETQETVGQWAIETFPCSDSESPRPVPRVLEECVEACLMAGADRQVIEQTVASAIFKEFYSARPIVPSWLPLELADVLICLYAAAARRGIDLAAEVERKMAVNRARTWRVGNDGTGYHVEGETP